MNTFFRLFKLGFITSKYRIFDNLIDQKGSIMIKLFYKIICHLLYPIGIFNRKYEEQYLLTALKELGPIYIKFGQTLSTRPDIIGDEASKTLKELQDELEPFNFQDVEKIFSQEIGKNINEVFVQFSSNPVAAASVAQVHKAITHCGNTVAIKVLRPGIKERCAKDLKVLYLITKLINSFYPKARNLKLQEIISILEDSVKMELNLRLEAAHASELRDNLTADQSIYIPKVYWQFTTQQILTLEWVEGVSIYDHKKLQHFNLNTIELSKKFATTFFEQTYRDGFFHADMHPGNMLITQQGQIVLLDFGIMGRLSTKDRISVARILRGFLSRDYFTVAKVHMEAGYIPKNTNLAIFAQHCRSICEPIVGLALKEVSISKILSQLFQVIQEFGLDIQPQLILLQKSMILVEGIGKILDPNINMWELAYPWMEKWTIKNLSFEAKLAKFITRFAKSVNKTLFEDYADD